MDGILKTERAAHRYAAHIATSTGEAQHVFRVPEGTAAYDLGYRFATCGSSEFSTYRDDGAEFVGSPVQP